MKPEGNIKLIRVQSENGEPVKKEATFLNEPFNVHKLFGFWWCFCLGDVWFSFGPKLEVWTYLNSVLEI